jgi:hypothetical protein
MVFSWGSCTYNIEDGELGEPFKLSGAPSARDTSLKIWQMQRRKKKNISTFCICISGTEDCG